MSNTNFVAVKLPHGNVEVRSSARDYTHVVAHLVPMESIARAEANLAKSEAASKVAIGNDALMVLAKEISDMKKVHENAMGGLDMGNWHKSYDVYSALCKADPVLMAKEAEYNKQSTLNRDAHDLKACQKALAWCKDNAGKYTVDSWHHSRELAQKAMAARGNPALRIFEVTARGATKKQAIDAAKAA